MPSFYGRLVVRISGQDAVSLNVGSTLPAQGTSMGKILLAQLPPESVRDLYGSEHIDKFTTRTVTSVVALLAELVLARKRDYALCDGELEVGLPSVASPIRGRQGIVMAALNVSTVLRNYSRRVKFS